jgi:hypothetical protein
MIHETADGRPFKTIRREVIDQFERRYLALVLERHDHDLSAVRRSSGLSKRHLRKLIRKHGLDVQATARATPAGPPATAPVELAAPYRGRTLALRGAAPSLRCPV